MEFSTTNTKNFYIKKNSTFPELKFPLFQFIMERFDITDDMMESIAVTFSMIEAKTGYYKIANSAANLKVNKNLEDNPDDEKYSLTYRFTESQTSRTGNFLGEFVVDFLNPEIGCGKIKLPINGYINIIISDSITKTTVI